MSRDSESFILQLYARTPAPYRDYCGLTVKKDEVVLNIWNITYGPHVYPKRQRRSLEEFSRDKQFQSEVHRLFGEHVLEYVKSIARNEKNLRNLPEKIFLRVLRYLAMKDILSLSQTSKIMFELCNTDNSWKILFRKCFKQRPTLDDAVVAERFGWKDALKQKITIKEKSTRRGKVPAITPKTNIKPKQIQNNIKCDVKTVNTKKVTIVGNINNNIVDKKGLPSKAGNPINLLEQKKELHNKFQTKTNTNSRGVEKNGQIVGKNTTIRNRIDSTKSALTLVAPKTPILNNLKVYQTKSVANINNPAKPTLQKTRNCLNLNSVKSTNTEIKINIPKTLEGTAACHHPKLKIQSAVSKVNTEAVKSKKTPLRK